MNYVEWLRVRNGVRIYAIVLGALIALCLIVRISVNGQLSNNEWIVSHIQHDPGTVISHSVVNGLDRTTLYNAKERTTITIDDKNDGGKLIHIVEPASNVSGTHTHHESVVNIQVSETQANGMESTTFDTNSPVNVVIFLVIGSVAALIFATIWGCSFACELGHLEYALLKPVTRTRYALGVIGYDVLGMAIVAVMSIVAAIICLSMFELPHFDFSKVAADTTVALVILLPLAWYAALNAATASLKRGSGAVIGFAWPVGLVFSGLGSAQLGDSPVANVFHTIFWTVSRLIPITYLSFSGGGTGHISDEGTPFTVRIATLTGLMLIYGALTLVQWRRVEA
jgi:hypothetical protein